MLTPDPLERQRRRDRRLLQELGVRAALAALIIAFDLLARVSIPEGGNRIILASAALALVVNAVYYAAARTGWRLRAQAHARTLVDVVLITVGLYGAGGLAAASYIVVYAIVSLYAGLVFSAIACAMAAVAATAAFLGMALAQQAGVLALTVPLPANAWAVAAFNLMMVNVVGGLTALLSEAYRRSRLRLAEAHRELERAHDASVRLNAELQRAAQLRALGEVAAGVAHELGNALSVAAGHLGLARSRAAAVPELERHLQKAGAGVDAALRIISNTLNTSRRSAAQPTAVDLAEVARRVVELKAYDLRRAGVSATLVFAPDLPRVHAIPFQVQQVLLNLITNAQQALTATAPPRRIAIRGTAADGAVVIEVADSGPGVPPAIRARLFEPFVTTKPEGTGLGLAISAGIVRDLGGELSAEDGAGIGAVFRVRLPAGGHRAAPTATAPGA